MSTIRIVFNHQINLFKKMKLTKSWALMLFGLSILSLSMQSCDDEPGTSYTENGIPKDFNYLTVRSIDVQVDVNDQFSGQYLYKVEVFDQNPLTTDTVVNLLAAGVANQSRSYATRVVIPQYVTTLFVRQTDPTKKSVVKAINIQQMGATAVAKCDFKPIVSSSPVKQKAAPVYTDKASDYALPASGVTTINSAITLMGSKYHIASGTTITNVVLGWLGNSELYVAGNLIINANGNPNMPPQLKLVVLPGGKVSISGFEQINFEQAGIIVAVHEGGTLEIDANVGLGNTAKLFNDGTVLIEKQFQVRTIGAYVVNNGSFTAEILDITNNGRFINQNQLLLNDKVVLNSNTLLVNNGTLEAKNQYISNNNSTVTYNNGILKTTFFNYSQGGGVVHNACRIETEFLRVEGSTINNGDGALILCQEIYANTSTFNLTGGSVIKSMDMGLDLEYLKVDDKGKVDKKVDTGVTFGANNTINGTMVGTAQPLFISWKIEDTKTGHNVVDLRGVFEFTVSSGSIPPARYFKTVDAGVTMSVVPVSVIASTSCNLGGVNSGSGDDDDDDDTGGGTGGDTGGGTGGDDDDDDTGGGVPPTDPTFPIEVVEGTDYVYSMEDLWPHMGDYDMNDFVFKIHAITKYVNSSNKVEKITFQLTPLASGSTKMVSAALQLDGVAEGAISVVSTQDIARIDQGHTQANVILFENVHALFGLSGHNIVNTFNNIEKVATSTYTFEITFTTPVDQASVSVDKLNFYSIVGDVNSTDRHEIHLAGYQPSSKVLKTSVSYKDENNMVWALMLPTSSYSYPAENVKIFNAYPKFNDWAKSGGKEFTDWYLNPSDSAGLIYNRK